jgi:hypothetical protein
MLIIVLLIGPLLAVFGDSLFLGGSDRAFSATSF